MRCLDGNWRCRRLLWKSGMRQGKRGRIWCSESYRKLIKNCQRRNYKMSPKSLSKLNNSIKTHNNPESQWTNNIPLWEKKLLMWENKMLIINLMKIESLLLWNFTNKLWWKFTISIKSFFNWNFVKNNKKMIIYMNFVYVKFFCKIHLNFYLLLVIA